MKTSDLNLIDRSIYSLALKNEDQNAAYTSLFIPANDCTYFPLFNIESEKVIIEKLQQNAEEMEFKPIHNPAIFCNENNLEIESNNFKTSEDSNDYSVNDFIQIDKNIDLVESNDLITVDSFELSPIHDETGKHEKSIFKSLLCKLSSTENKKTNLENTEELKIESVDELNADPNNDLKTAVTNLEISFFKFLFKKKKKADSDLLCLNPKNISQFNLSNNIFSFYPNDKEHFYNVQALAINDQNYFSFISKFNLLDISYFNLFLQESFISSSPRYLSIFDYFFPEISYNNLNNDTQFPNDLYFIQNLRLQKPLFDDFAVFFDVNYEYSKFSLNTLNNFEFINDIERTGQSFFYLDENQRYLDHNFRHSFLKKILNFMFISSGAFALFSYSFK